MDSWHERIQEMKRWLDENMEENPRLTEMAARLGYSYFHTVKKFREIEGVSFREYLANRKIQRAAADLYGTAERVIDIAVKYGYSSQEAFTRAFARVFGVTPTVYRRMPKPAPAAEKSALLRLRGLTESILSNGGNDMKLYVKQMCDWNCYAYYAEAVDEPYWEYFRSELWWQLGDSFIKPYDNVQDFEFCAENFTKHGETAVKQQLRMLPAPWEKALDFLIPEMKALGVDWFLHGSAALALWGVDVAPKDVNVIVPNYSDYDKVRERFYKLAIKPFERCDNWLMSGLGNIFHEAVIGFAFHNKELEPFDMSRLDRMDYRGETVYVPALESLRRDNEAYGRKDRVERIERRMREIARG